MGADALVLDFLLYILIKFNKGQRLSTMAIMKTAAMSV